MDLNGLSPGDSFPSEGAAAQDAIDSINPTSISEGVEYAGNIYKNGNGSYSATIPRSGGKDWSEPCPCSQSTTATYHTHGSADPGYFNEGFSSNDLMRAIGTQQSSYLGTPAGQSMKFDVNTGKFKINRSCGR